MNEDKTFCGCYIMLIKCKEENIFSYNFRETLSLMKFRHPRTASVKVLQNDSQNINLKSTSEAIYIFQLFHQKLCSNNC